MKQKMHIHLLDGEMERERERERWFKDTQLYVCSLAIEFTRHLYYLPKRVLK